MNRKFNIIYFMDNCEKMPAMSMAMWIKLKIIMAHEKKIIS